MYDNFKKEYADLDPIGTGKLTQAKFTRWLKVYGRINGLEVKEGKSDSTRTIKFVNHAIQKNDSVDSLFPEPDGSDGI
ncbi:MAG: hypothetical protein ACYC5G_03750 [Candidatus Doudnabacteria bacterium]